MAMEIQPNISNADVQALYAGMAAHMQKTVREVLLDPIFVNHLAEELMDRIDGFEDDRMAHFIKEAEGSESVPLEDVIALLRTGE